eukprot:1598395-Rhodomonas_salina.1
MRKARRQGGGNWEVWAPTILVMRDCGIWWRTRTAGAAGGVQGAGSSQVDLATNELGNDGAAYLNGGLGECKALADLNLSSKMIGDEGAGSLA